MDRIVFNKDKGFFPGTVVHPLEKKTYGVLSIYPVKTIAQTKDGEVIYKPKDLFQLEACAELYFRNTGSVDAMIEALTWLKQSMISKALQPKQEMDYEVGDPNRPTSWILGSDPQDSSKIVCRNIGEES